MKNYTTKTAILLYINFLIGIIHCLHQLKVISFIPDPYYMIVPISFLLTFALWGIALNLKKSPGGRSDIWKKL
ncbi:MAG: hypothetical protein CMC04_09260 [Flavobacteriaceae bacterium]|nr:hypothetical protein [Flavobacteriaceae bacterium]